MGEEVLFCTVFLSIVDVMEVISVEFRVSCADYRVVECILIKGISVAEEIFVIIETDNSAKLILNYVQVCISRSVYADRAIEKYYCVERACYSYRRLRITYYVECDENIGGSFANIDSNAFCGKRDVIVSDYRRCAV